MLGLCQPPVGRCLIKISVSTTLPHVHRAARFTRILSIVLYENANLPLQIQVDGEFAYAGFSVWPNTSTVFQAFDDWSADSFISRVLAEPAAGPYWTLLISPLEDDLGIAGSFGGLLTIGEIANVPQIFNITKGELQKNNFPDLGLIIGYPYLNNPGMYNNVAYYAVIDAIKWGSVSATLNSSIPGTPAGKISATIDSTDSWIQVPYSVTEQLYKNLENATYRNDTRLWYFKCTELNINITIAGYDYPLSPLTAVQRVDGLNCVGTVSFTSTDALGVLLILSLSSKQSPRMLEVTLFLVFPSVRPLLFKCRSSGC